MKQTTFIVFVVALLFTCRPLMAQTTFQDLPVEFRKNGYPQLVEECKDVLKAAYMAQNKLGTYHDIPNWEGYPVELWEYFTGEDIKKHVKKRGLVLSADAFSRKASYLDSNDLLGSEA